MNKHTRNMLENAFAAPTPQRKDEFLKRLPISEMSMWGFVLSQFGYIRKRVWVLNAALLAASFIGAAAVPEKALWFLSALTPVMAVTAVAENGRSQCFGMWELELSARYSLRSVLFSRILLVGCANILVFACMWGIAGTVANEPVFHAGVYILCPYFITSYLCLCVTRKMRSHSSIYICIGIGAVISAVPYILADMGLLAEIRFAWVAALLVLSVAGAGGEYARMIKMEEYEWSLS